MACETACPSGVRYAPLVEHTRAAIEQHHERPWADRLFRMALFQRPALSGAAAAARLLPLAGVHLLRRVPGFMALLPLRLRNLLTLAPEAPVGTRGDRRVHAGTRRRSGRRVGLVTGCVQRVFFGDGQRGDRRVLAAEGCDVFAPAAQGCCGALALHAGRDDDARAFARQLIAAFESCRIRCRRSS